MSVRFLKTFWNEKKSQEQSLVQYCDVTNLKKSIRTKAKREIVRLMNKNIRIQCHLWWTFHKLFLAMFTEQERRSKLSLDLIKHSQKATAWRNINKSYLNNVNFQNVVSWKTSFLVRMTIVAAPQVLVHKAIAVPSAALKTQILPKVGYCALQGIRQRPPAATGGYATQYLVASVKYWKL